MSGVYTNIARKRIEQSHEASHAPQKTTDPLNHSVDKKEHLQEEKDPSRVTLSNQNAAPSLSVPEKEDKTKIQFASTLASKQDSMIDIKQSINLSLPPDALETIRKIVKNPGKEEVLYVRLSKEEKDKLADISYTYKRQGIRTSDNEVVRVALNALLEDYRTNGANSLLAIIIASLHD
jgi:hypothetical protein